MNDEYTSTEVCVERLLKEYKKHGKLIIAVDFDSTVYDYYSDGGDFPRAWKIIKECKDAGCLIVCFTASDVKRWEKIKQHFLNNGVELDSINENPVKGLPFGHWGKIYYNILLDDRAGLGQALDILEKTFIFYKQQTSNL